MSGISTNNPRFPQLGVNRRLALGGLALAAALAICLVLVFRFVAAEQERDLLAWQVRLGIVADSRAAAVEDWLAGQFDELEALAANPALRVYLGELAPDGSDTAEAGYLRNLLTVAADRAGFTAPPVGPEVPANVTRTGTAGLLLLDPQGRVLVGTRTPPPFEGALGRFVESLPARWQRGETRALLDLHYGAAGRLTLGFAVPVYAVQTDAAAQNQVAVVLGVKPVEAALMPLLRQPGAVEATAETILVRRQGELVEYLTPLADGAAPLERRLALSTPGLAAAFAVSHGDGFAIKRDYSGEPVLATARHLAAAPWTLVHKIDRSEALGPGEARLRRLLAILLLAIALAAVAIGAAWYKGASRRAAAAARRFEEMAARFEQQRDFLRLLSDSQPNANAIIDLHGHYRFANAAAARRAGVDGRDIIGKSLVSVLGPERAKRYAELNREAREASRTVAGLHRFADADGVSILQSVHVPMAETAELPAGVLLVEEDVTAAVGEREHRLRIERQLVETLVSLVDRRDPHAADHSSRVARIARAIAEEMDLDERATDTAEFAGRLLNVGKILVPVELLTKAGELSDGEIRTVRDGLQASAELIDGIEFDGPVAETLRQCRERWDGSGVPRGLAAEEILLPARIVAVANAIVAIVSPRAYRPAAEADAAIECLLADVGKAFDRAVVAALVNRLDNHGGRAEWAEFLAPPGRKTA